VDGPAGSAYDVLKENGYNVSVVQNPTSWLVDDVAVAERMPAAQNGSAILVVHSYGGVSSPSPERSEGRGIKNPPPGRK
jgi:hypothetical protein